jgi:SWI/SNF-related matrix-associated actin-dependent regulator of chromatin subfamily A containing DEAD/H box 1
MQATVAMVRKELEGLPDFELNSICQEHSRRLADLVLPQEALLDSAKFERLRGLLPELMRDGHRVLIFSQWTRILDLLEVRGSTLPPHLPLPPPA